MMKYVIILFMISCTTTRLSSSKTVKLDGSKSHAVAGKYLVQTKWVALNGKADILNPDSLVTNATMSGSRTFELWGRDNEGLEGRDTMNVIIK